jgi:6-phosphogluconolactonase
MSSHLLFVGTYTRSTSPGIHAFHIDPATARLTAASDPTVVDNPSFLAIARNRILYATSEAGENGGCVSAYTIHDDGSLVLINRQPFGAAGPCHVSVTADGRHVFSANYHDGSIAAFHADHDGKIGPASIITFHGHGPNPARQTKPHAHSVTIDPGDRLAVAADLGTDRLMLYRIRHDAVPLEPLDPPCLGVSPGAGPRHVAFHPDRPLMYLINEMAGSVTAFHYDPKGSFAPIGEYSALPAGFSGERSGADIHVHPSGQFLYCSNRNHDSITAFLIRADGSLAAIEHIPVQGSHPRNFMITSDGAYLLVANMLSDAIEGFKILDDGTLGHIGRLASVPMPTCLVTCQPRLANARSGIR